jgi:hypothetical protein
MEKAWLCGLVVAVCLALAPVAHGADGDEAFDKGAQAAAGASSVTVPANVLELQQLVGVAPSGKKPPGGAPVAPGPIRAQGMVLDVAGEAMQIAGKLVVDKATAEALRIVRRQLEKALSCSTTTVFTRTCQVVARLRMADLVSSPDPLLQALAQDLMAQLGGSLTGVELYASLARDVWPSLLRVRNLDARELGVLVVQRIRDRGAAALAGLTDAAVKQKDAAQRWPIALGLASASLASCLEANVNARACPAADWISRTAHQLGVEEPTVVAAAQAIATRSLVVLVGAQESQGGPRAVSAGVELAFDVMCLSVDFDHGCEGAETKASTATHLKARLGIARGALLALVEGEPLRVVVAFGDLLELGGTKLGTSTRRGLRLLGGVLDYARTTASGADKDDGALHEQRTQIIRALSDDLTDRSDRGNEWIWSIGGSLRVMATAQAVAKPGSSDHDVKGVIVPVSLPLGIGLDYLGDDGDLGLHVELSGVDLGRYAEIQSGTVHRPDVLSAVNVSLAVGFFYGTSMPWYVGGVVGYSPAISQGKLGDAGSETTPERGFYVGLTTGVYVPLFDLD